MIFGFFYESMFWLLRLYLSFVWLKRERSFRYRLPLGDGKKIYVLIPALAEVNILEETIKYFNDNFLNKADDIFVIIVTTEKEKMIARTTYTTIDVAQNLAHKYQKVIHMHFPEKYGKMAHQLNYAIKNFRNKDVVIKDDDWIAVYNADSRPEKQTFDWIRAKLQTDTCSVFQQYGCYSENISTFNPTEWPSILVSGALWQIRWSIGFEIYNAFKQSKFLLLPKKFYLNYPLNYCIGHGLFITNKLLKRIGGFNEDMHNEDAILGLQLSDSQETIVPIPYFDISKSPDTVKMLYIQKSNWYFGPLQAYSYMMHILQKSSYGIFRKIRLFLLSTKLFLHAIFWIVGPTLLFLCLLLSIVNHNIILISLSLIIIILFTIPNMISYLFLSNLAVVSTPMRFPKLIGFLLRGFFFCYILHGLSAYRGLLLYITQLIGGKEAIKEKTMIKK